MDHNPYSPPQTNTDLPIPQEVARRPISVWLLIVLLVAIALILVLATVRLVSTIMGHWAEVSSAGAVVVTLAWRVSIIAIFIAAAYGAYHRRPWSRWFGVALLVLLALLSIFRPDTTVYENDAERAGGTIARFIVMPLLFASWMYALAFSSKAKKYFVKTSSP